MKDKHKKYALSILLTIWFIIAVLCWMVPTKDISNSERRTLASMPEWSVSNVMSAQFMEQFEEYAMDQFIERDAFRKLKSMTSLYLLQLNDVNDLLYQDGHINKINYPLNEDSIEHATNKFNYIYDSYLKDSDVNIYSSIIYDKGYHLSEGSLSIDYEHLSNLVQQEMEYANYIEINDLLSLTDFYASDTHWKQENLIDVANTLLKEMHTFEGIVSYSEQIALKDFEGVYQGQSGLSLGNDTLTFLTNQILEDSIVQDSLDPTLGAVYDISAVVERDPYELYVGGATPLISITNELATNTKELVIFRDSFASSLAPLLVHSYSKITLIDIRYMSSENLSEYITFSNQDVLFMYSSLLLNDSYTLK